MFFDTPPPDFMEPFFFVCLLAWRPHIFKLVLRPFFHPRHGELHVSSVPNANTMMLTTIVQMKVRIPDTARADGWMSHDATAAVEMKKGTYVKLSTASIPLPTVSRIEYHMVLRHCMGYVRTLSFITSSTSGIVPTRLAFLGGGAGNRREAVTSYKRQC